MCGGWRGRGGGGGGGGEEVNFLKGTGYCEHLVSMTVTLTNKVIASPYSSYSNCKALVMTRHKESILHPIICFTSPLIVA